MKRKWFDEERRKNGMLYFFSMFFHFITVSKNEYIFFFVHSWLKRLVFGWVDANLLETYGKRLLQNIYSKYVLHSSQKHLQWVCWEIFVLKIFKFLLLYSFYLFFQIVSAKPDWFWKSAMIFFFNVFEFWWNSENLVLTGLLETMIIYRCEQKFSNMH